MSRALYHGRGIRNTIRYSAYCAFCDEMADTLPPNGCSSVRPYTSMFLSVSRMLRRDEFCATAGAPGVFERSPEVNVWGALGGMRAVVEA